MPERQFLDFGGPAEKENKLKRISPVFYLHMFGAALFLAAGVVGFAAGRGGIAFLPLGGYALFLLLSWAQGAARKDAEKGYAGGTFAFEMLLLVKTAPLLCLFLLPGTFANVHSERATDVAHSFLLFFCVLFLFANAVTEHAALRRALARGDALAAVLPRPLALTLRPVSPFTFAAFFAALAVHALGAGFIGPLPLLAACALALPLGAVADAFLYAAPSRSGTALFAAFSLARAGVPLLVLYFYPNGLAGALETSPFRPAFCALCILYAALLCAQLALALFGAFFAASTFPRKKNI